MKKKFNLEESIDLEGLSLSEPEKRAIRQYIKNILLKPKQDVRSNIVDVKPDKLNNIGLSDSKWEEIRDFDGYDVYSKTGDGYTLLETVKRKRSCNRHDDCDKAEIEKFGKIDYYPNFHCHDDECEDCFGS